jgi:MerR family transcriptional regulator, copper efflux regulator
MTRGKLSEITGINSRTIRFYEDKGIIPTPPRDTNGYRNYDDSMVVRLHFIKNAQNIGFSLEEIKELAEMKITPGMSCESVHKRASLKIQDVENKINELERIKDGLIKFTRFCSPGKNISDCQFITLLEK